MKENIDTRIKALENDVRLNVKEQIIAFKRLKDIELRVEKLEVHIKKPR